MGAPVLPSEVSELQLALQTAALELSYERSSRTVQEILKDEDIRRLKYQLLVLEEDRDELIEQLEREEQRCDNLELDLSDVSARCDELEAENVRLNEELRVKLREGSTMRAELNAMSSSSSEQTKLLTEKLALSRELANLKPEVEHLRAQISTNQQLLSDKLSLERQLSTVQVELENAQRAGQRAKERQRKTGDYDVAYEAQLDELQKQLKEEKVARREAQRELERRTSEAGTSEVPSSRTKDGAEDERLKGKMEELRKELSTEKKERQKIEKAFEKEKAAWEAQKSILDDKLSQFRTKLRSTKEQLKEKEAELGNVKLAPTVNSVPISKTQPANPKKRVAAQMDSDASQLGTPGNGMPVKRGKKVRAAGAIPGEKSNFSITPFLNRTMSAPPDDGEMALGQPQDEPSVANATVEDSEATPTQPKKAAAPKASVIASKPLAPATSAKTNANPAPSKRMKKTTAAVAPSLDTIEDASPEKPAAQPPKPNTMVPKLKASRPARKSLLDFSTFNAEPALVQQKKKKQRTLGNTSILGGNTTTLFDEEDGDAPKAKAIPGKGLFGGRAMTFGRGGFANAKNRLKGPLVMADDGSGFQFSPLKKDKRRIAAERQAGETTVMG